MADYSTEQNLRLAQKMLEQQGEIKQLRAERDALQAELAATKEQLRLANIDAQNNEAERADAEDCTKKLRSELAAARAAIERAIEAPHSRQTVRMLRAALPSRPDDPEEIRRLAQATESHQGEDR